MKKWTAFFTIAILVCIATFVVFASNPNRDVSYSQMVVAQPSDNISPFGLSDIDNTGTDSEGPLWSTASSWSGWYRNKDGDLKCGASGYGYVSCYTDNENYETTYSLYAEVPVPFQDPNFRNPQALPMEGSFYDSVYRWGELNASSHNPRGSRGRASASGKNPSNGDQHNTSAASPTPGTARDLEIICDACDDYGCSLCDKYR